MQKALVALFGVALLIITINFRSNLVENENEAYAKDKEDKSYGMISGPLPCKWEVNPPERVQSENKSQSIVITIVNEYDGEECESLISLRAPGFDLSPVKEEQKINLKEKQEGSLSWIISPRKAGSYEIAVSDPLNSKVFGISVTNMFGLSAVQAKTASFLGTIFGPMLTVPWWWEKWFMKRKREDNQTPNENKEI